MKMQFNLWAILFLFSTTIWASHTAPFSDVEFRKLQKDNAVILVDVWAGWCSTCTTQSNIIEQYQKKYPKSGLHILRVDFDKDKQWVRHFRAPRQGTLLLYRGKKQVWYSIGETRKRVIFSELNKVAGAE